MNSPSIPDGRARLLLIDDDGLDVLRQIAARHPGLPVIVMPGRVDVATAVTATQLGAQHYLTKPVSRKTADQPRITRINADLEDAFCRFRTHQLGEQQSRHKRLILIPCFDRCSSA